MANKYMKKDLVGYHRSYRLQCLSDVIETQTESFVWLKTHFQLKKKTYHIFTSFCLRRHRVPTYSTCTKKPFCTVKKYNRTNLVLMQIQLSSITVPFTVLKWFGPTNHQLFSQYNAVIIRSTSHIFITIISSEKG